METIHFLLPGLLIGWVAGFAQGNALAHSYWISNANEPKRILRKGRFFKVVEIANPWSWDMCKIHEDDNPGYDNPVTGPEDSND